MANCLVDTSSWINFFAKRHKAQAEEVRSLLEAGHAVINGLILAELLQGFRRTEERRLIESRLRALPFVALIEDDFAQAGHLSAQLRCKGETSGLADLLIAQSAHRNGLPLLHYDTDFRRIAKTLSLKFHPLSL